MDSLEWLIALMPNTRILWTPVETKIHKKMSKEKYLVVLG